MPKKFKSRSVRDADWDSIPIVEGKVTDKGVIDTGERKAPFIVVDNGTSLIRVYESTDLEDLFKSVVVNDSVRIEFVEKIAIKGGKQFVRYDSSCWTGQDDVEA